MTFLHSSVRRRNHGRAKQERWCSESKNMDLWGTGASSAAEPSDVSFPQTESERKADRKPCELTRDVLGNPLHPPPPGRGHLPITSGQKEGHRRTRAPSRCHCSHSPGRRMLRHRGKSRPQPGQGPAKAGWGWGGILRFLIHEFVLPQSGFPQKQSQGKDFTETAKETQSGAWGREKGQGDP